MITQVAERCKIQRRIGSRTPIHQPTRLRIMAALVNLDSSEKANLSFLRNLLELTDGNLSVHLQELEEAGYVNVERTFFGLVVWQFE